VDANVIRVLSRVLGLRGDPKSSVNQATLWSWAERLVPAEAPGEFNQAVMELGALVCDPDEPRCTACPLLSICAAGNSADPSALPEFPPGKTKVNRTHSSALIREETGRVLIVQRPLHGLWGGLWEFPRAVCRTGESPAEAAVRAAREIVGLEVTLGARVALVRHAVTHHKIALYGFLARPVALCPKPEPRECAAVRWESLTALEAYAFSSPQALLRDALRGYAERPQSSAIQPMLPLEDAD
jgi:A/G-specific adenine glycosylase